MKYPSLPKGNPDDRRTALTALGAIVAGFLGTLIPAGAGLVSLLDSLRPRSKPRAFRDENAARSDYVKVADIDAVPADGQPRRFVVLQDHVDAWNFNAKCPVGAIYLRRAGTDGGLVALHSICPHLGCSVAPSPDGQAFHCPCHNSAFDLDGKRVVKAGKENPSPRDMDRLELDADRLQRGEVWIRFQNFETGKEEQKPTL